MNALMTALEQFMANAAQIASNLPPGPNLSMYELFKRELTRRFDLDHEQYQRAVTALAKMTRI